MRAWGVKAVCALADPGQFRVFAVSTVRSLLGAMEDETSAKSYGKHNPMYTLNGAPPLALQCPDHLVRP